MRAPFCKLTGVECIFVGKGDPCPLTDEQLWVVMDHNNCCQHQVDEDGPGEENGHWAEGGEQPCSAHSMNSCRTWFAEGRGF